MTVIEIYADVCCPFAHAGLRAVLRRRTELGRDHDVAVRMRAWPLELVNGTPLDPGLTAQHAEELRSQVAPNLFTHLDTAHFPKTSLPALALAEAAYRRSQATGEAVSLAVRNALFEEGRDISQPDVLAAVARANGIEPAGPADDAEVLAEWHTGERRGVKGSPHLFCGAIDAFCPSLDISKDGSGQLHVRRDTEALDAFLSACLVDG